MEKFEIRQVNLDNQKTYKLRCPKCGVWGFLDDDQFNGRISILCDCGFHETIDFKTVLGETIE